MGVAFAVVHAQAQYEELTDEQIAELAMEKTLTEMDGGMTPGQIAYVAALLSAPEVAAALEADGEYSIDSTDVQMGISLPQAAIDSWNGSYEDPRFDGYSSDDGGTLGRGVTQNDPIVAWIHALGCVNGRFQNVSTLWIKLPEPWYPTSSLGFLGLRIQHGRVRNCGIIP